LTTRGVNRRFGNDIARPDRLPSIGVGHEDSVQFGDDLRLRPGVAAVGRFHEGNIELPAGGVQDQVEEVVERPRAGVDHDLVADRLRVLRGLDDVKGGAPALATVGGLREKCVSSKGLRVRVVIWLVGRCDECVPHGVRGPSFDRVGSCGVLVSAELASIGREGDECDEITPGLATVSRGGRSYRVLVVSAVEGDGGCVGRAIGPELHPGVGRPLVG